MKNNSPPLHPLVELFLTSHDNFQKKLESFKNSDNVFEHTLYSLNHLNTLTKMELHHKIFQEIDQALIIGHPDENLYRLFIMFAITLYWGQSEYDKVDSLLSISNSFSFKNTHPTIHALYMQASSLAVFHKGLFKEALQMTKTAVTLIKKEDYLYNALVLNYASMLGAYGRLSDLSPEHFKIFNSNKSINKVLIIATTKIHHYASLGDYEEGFRLIEKYTPHFKAQNYDYQVHLDDFKLLSGVFDPSQYQNERSKKIASIFKQLSASHITKAIDEYKSLMQLKSADHDLSKIQLYHLQLHLSLCAGNISEAYSLLKYKDVQGAGPYFDDFFLLRILLLDGKQQEAHCVFNRFMQNIEHYGAFKRVLFELQFAKEFSVKDFFALTYAKKINATFKAPLPLKNTHFQKSRQGVQLLVGNSPQLQSIKKLIQKYATLPETILILGETGTGKELVAKALHQEGYLANEPFLAINCGALTDTLLESELFGYEPGAFTGALKGKKGIFEAAGQGTVFLDEFGETSEKLQVSLLRVLESSEIRMLGGDENRKVKCRILVATNKDLKEAVKNGEFRQDLYYRLNRLEIQLPPLREHKEDIAELTNLFLSEYEHGRNQPKQVTQTFLKALQSYSWPGNIRELKNSLERLRILNPDKDLFDIDDLNSIQFQQNFYPQSENVNEDKLTSEHKDRHSIDLIPNTFDSESHSQKKLNAVQRMAYIKEMFIKRKILTRKQIIDSLKLHPLIATQTLQQLCEENFITRKQPTKSQRSSYFELNDKEG